MTLPAECDRFDAMLADYLENDLPTAARAAADAHLASCARCRALADDLLAITRQASALGPIEPERDLWAGIAARIEAPVVPIGRTGEQAIAPLHVERTTTTAIPERAPATRERFLLSRRWLAAAASVLVATSVGSTYAVMRVAGNDAAQPVVAATPTPTAPTADSTPAAAPAPEPTTVATTADPRPAEPRSAEPRPRAVEAPSGDARLVAGAAGVYAPAMQTYDKEIATLRQALKQRADLDSSTVAVLERNLRVIDQAIAESRRALQRDPNSRLLGDQLTRSLDMKVELLRTAVLLPARS